MRPARLAAALISSKMASRFSAMDVSISMPLMTDAYPDWDYNGSHAVARVATKLYKARSRPCRLAPLVFMSDPKRVPDVIAAAQSLPNGTAIIYRHFGKADKVEEAEALRQITFSKSQQLLIGADPELAIAIGADGVHFKRDPLLAAPTLWRKRCPDWIISMAGIKQGEYQANLSVLDALIVSSIFKSQSHSAGEPIGTTALKSKTQTLPMNIFALGGINNKTAPNLLGSGAAGLAAIDGLLKT